MAASGCDLNRSLLHFQHPPFYSLRLDVALTDLGHKCKAIVQADFKSINLTIANDEKQPLGIMHQCPLVRDRIGIVANGSFRQYSNLRLINGAIPEAFWPSRGLVQSTGRRGNTFASSGH